MNLDSLSISKQGSMVVLVCSFRIPKSLLETVVPILSADSGYPEIRFWLADHAMYDFHDSTDTLKF